MRDGLAWVADAEDVRAWVIRTAPEEQARMELADYLRADEVVVLVPDRATLAARAAERSSYATMRVIDRWFERAGMPTSAAEPAARRWAL